MCRPVKDKALPFGEEFPDTLSGPVAVLDLGTLACRSEKEQSPIDYLQASWLKIFTSRDVCVTVTLLAVNLLFNYANLIYSRLGTSPPFSFLGIEPRMKKVLLGKKEGTHSK